MAGMIAPILALAIMQSASTVPAQDRGSNLYDQCRATIRVQNGTGDGGLDDLHSNSCVAYIDGFTDGLLVAGDTLICVEGATLATIARVYIAYMEAHPKLMDSGKADGLLHALLENYRCPVKK
jgi:Rap1a immunity proteins